MKSMVQLGLVVLLSLFSLSFGQVFAQEDILEMNKQVVTQFVDAFNNADYQAMRRLMAEEYIEHAEGSRAGRDNVIEFSQALRAGFSDLTNTIVAIFAEGDRVAVRLMSSGTHDGTFNGIPATGVVVNIQAIEIFRLDNGIAVEHWGVSDQLSVLQQIGIIPSAPNAPVPELTAEPNAIAVPTIENASMETMERNKAVMQRWFAEGWGGQPEIAREIMVPTFSINGVMFGPEGPITNVTATRGGFSDIAVTVEDQIAEGNFVVTRYRARGTHDGAYNGISATGNEVSVPGIVIWEFEDGQVVRDWTVFDTLGLLIQLGVFPPA